MKKKAFNFKLVSTSDKVIELKKIKSKFVILYFYPKDDTPGCTIETKDFNSLLSKFKKLNCEIYGISKDDLKSQKITLPLIYSIKKASQADRRSMRSILKRKKLSNEDKKAINQFVKENNGFKYAENVMSEYKNKALKTVSYTHLTLPTILLV